MKTVKLVCWTTAPPPLFLILKIIFPLGDTNQVNVHLYMVLSMLDSSILYLTNPTHKKYTIFFPLKRSCEFQMWFKEKRKTRKNSRIKNRFFYLKDKSLRSLKLTNAYKHLKVLLLMNIEWNIKTKLYAYIGHK